MSKLFNPLRVLIAVLCVSSALLLGCLPGEEDVAVRYNGINQRAAVANAGASLGTAATNYLAYLKSLDMTQTAPLSKGIMSTFGKPVPDPEPVTPRGLMVKRCGHNRTADLGPGDPRVFGAVAYFTRTPDGVPDLRLTGEAMAAALAERYGAESVGLRTPTGYLYPLAITDPVNGLGCSGAIGGDIAIGSPIFVTGFRSENEHLPLPKQFMDAAIERPLSVPCPSGMTGVVPRLQTCTLKMLSDQGKREETVILLGHGKAKNDVQRPDREWSCNPDPKTPLPAATAVEVQNFCHDPAKDLKAVADATLQMNTESFKKTLETGTTGYYAYKCQTDGSGKCVVKPFVGGCAGPDCKESCDAQGTCKYSCVGPNCTKIDPPCTGPNCPKKITDPVVSYRCAAIAMPPLYVTNPKMPLATDGNLNLVGTATQQNCGHGWSGDLMARYLVKRCDLFKTVDGTETHVALQQTIYHITYAGALCQTTVDTVAACPVGNPRGTVPITRHLEMLKPVALDWTAAQPGMLSPGLSPSEVSSNDSRQEIKDMAASQGYIIPNLGKATLDALRTNDTQWSLTLANAMQSRDSTSIRSTVVACNDAGAPCGKPEANTMDIWVDSGSRQRRVGTRSLDDIPTKEIRLDNLICKGGTGSCNPLLDLLQSTCNGTCEPDQNNPQIKLTDSLFESLLRHYLSTVLLTLPDEAKIVPVYQSNDIPLLNNPDTVCQIAGETIDHLVIVSMYDNSKTAITNSNRSGFYQCQQLQGKQYSDVLNLLSDAIDAYTAKGHQITIFSTQLSAFPGNAIRYDLAADVLNPTGKFSNEIKKWINKPVKQISPCDNIK